MKKNNKIYIACIETGSYEEYNQNEIFASFDKSKVEKWVERFNKIIETYKKYKFIWRDLAHEANFEGKYRKRSFNEDWFIYDDANAIMMEVEFRD